MLSPQVLAELAAVKEAEAEAEALAEAERAEREGGGGGGGEGGDELAEGEDAPREPRGYDPEKHRAIKDAEAADAEHAERADAHRMQVHDAEQRLAELDATMRRAAVDARAARATLSHLRDHSPPRRDPTWRARARESALAREARAVANSDGRDYARASDAYGAAGAAYAHGADGDPRTVADAGLSYARRVPTGDKPPAPVQPAGVASQL